MLDSKHEQEDASILLLLTGVFTVLVNPIRFDIAMLGPAQVGI